MSFLLYISGVHTIFLRETLLDLHFPGHQVSMEHTHMDTPTWLDVLLCASVVGKWFRCEYVPS